MSLVNLSTDDEAERDIETLRSSLPSNIVGPGTAELWLAFGRIEATHKELSEIAKAAQAFIDARGPARVPAEHALRFLLKVAKDRG